MTKLKLSPDVADLNPHLAGHENIQARVRPEYLGTEPGFKSKLEAKAWRTWIPTQNFKAAFYEPLVLHLTGGNYTPDIICITPEGEMWIIEVKGAWNAYQSGRSSKRNLKQAAQEFKWLGRFFSLMPEKRSWKLTEIE